MVEGMTKRRSVSRYEEVADTPNLKLLRISRVDFVAQPETYRTNSKKEQTMLEYVRHFERQFENLHPRRRPLLLAPRNECGMRKFICTSLRPTQLPFQDVYDYDKCARFVADFVTYEPLELATTIPQHMPSPSAVISWQAGDCFDMAQLLASLLLGVGYDAYVVSGYARSAITHCDQSGTLYNIDGDPVEKAAAVEQVRQKYAVPPRKQLESNFLKNKVERENSAKEKKAAPLDWKQLRALEQMAGNEAEELDELKGKRVHSWVMLLAGKRLLEQMLFLEPSTGDVYSVENAPYYAIESVWNASNYWVNLQDGVPCSKLSYDLNSHSDWEVVLFDATMTGMGDDDADETGADRVSKLAAETMAAEQGPDDEKLQIDMPPSWVTRLHVPRELFQARCPEGKKEVVYRKGTYETFAPYSREDGLVEQVTIFNDVERTDAAEVRQIFANRKDRLAKRVITRANNCTHEFFDPGRAQGLKELVYIQGTRREFHFYASARLDGLICRIEEIGKKTTQIFDGSKDSLTWRSVSYHVGKDAPSGEPQPRKMAEKFKRTPSLDAEEDVAKRTFDLAGGTIKVRYHYGHDRVTASFRTYAKDGSGHNFVQVDPFARPLTDAQLLEEYTKLQTYERECINEIRDSDRKAKDILKKREEEEADIAEAEGAAAQYSPGNKPVVPAHLTVSVYDTARSKLATQEEPDDNAASQVPHDYLTPFLVTPIGPNDPPLKFDEAYQAYEACRKSLKDRLVERANIVQSRLDEENAALSKRQAAFARSRDHMDPADEAEYEKYAQEALFRIQILEQRLDRHTEISLAKFAEMDARLRNDPRLRALNSPTRGDLGDGGRHHGHK
ncbi:hypothetical protein AB1Y20_012673 [Prymnesium parvum]|uniref:Dynein regulatory complex subunit 7 n=1 Tax=Prymnesium parvum TaxID=97485 RepID=A0AB34ILC7_PRYPA